MKTLKIYFLLMLLIQTISISAQSVISGKITNNDSSPIVGATILLSNGMDSTYITGTTSDLDGRFKMINVKSGNYFLSLSMIGYKKANIPLQIKETSLARQSPPPQTVRAVKSKNAKSCQPLAAKNTRLNPSRQSHWRVRSTV